MPVRPNVHYYVLKLINSLKVLVKLLEGNH